jgi:hypothetical protein
MSTTEQPKNNKDDSSALEAFLGLGGAAIFLFFAATVGMLIYKIFAAIWS